MNLTPRFVLSAIALCVAIVFGLSQVSAAFGSQAALVTGLLVLSIPIALNPPSHILGALASARDTQERPGDIVQLTLAANAVIYRGALVAVSATGYAVPGADTAGLTVIGRAEDTVDNTGGADGAAVVNVKRGCFKFANSATAALTIAHVGTIAYAADDETVANTSDNAIKAGLVIAIETDGVWIDTRYHVPVAGTPADGSVTAAKLAANAVETAKIKDANVTAPKLADAVADLIRTTTVAIANTATPDGKANVTGAVKDAQGNALAGRFLVAVYFDDAAYGAPSDLGALTAKTNSALLAEVVDDAVALVLTHSDGTWGVELDTAADGTVHVHAAVLAAFATANVAITGN
jgi:hypothetical protein